MKIFTVYDQKAEAYLQPFFMKTNAMAIRGFTSLVNEPGHNFNQYPEDYILFSIGDFNEETGQITQLREIGVPLGRGIDFKTEHPQTSFEELKAGLTQAD